MRPDCRSGDPAKRAWLSKGSPCCPAAVFSQVSDEQKKPPVVTSGFLDSGTSGNRWPPPASREVKAARDPSSALALRNRDVASRTRDGRANHRHAHQGEPTS